ncbi:hypothetical protein [Vannielia litorea]|uniref:hypothetical protein n=1 Tax=Vannielia litorea TaxID=1217970 RepID=UPI001BCE9BD3|nr:hypothetical protein [Vannielia litorea]MBS8228383.1 hypothetical protein [Vannielia litorea]
MIFSSQHWPPRLRDGERVVWQGRPARAFSISQQDVIELLVGMPGLAFLVGFGFLWLNDPENAGIGLLGHLGFGLYLLAAAFYLMGGRLLLRAWLRSRSEYLLTDQRAFIATRLFGSPFVREYRVTQDVVMQSDGDLDTIWLGPSIFLLDFRKVVGRQWPQAGFENLENGAAVLDLIRKARRSAA